MTVCARCPARPGIVSDRMTSRKAAITLGFAAGAAAKFGMASASTVGLLFAGKAVDRLANGIQVGGARAVAERAAGLASRVKHGGAR